MADQELQIVEGFFVFFYIQTIQYVQKKVLEDQFMCSLEFVGLPPRGPNDTAQNLPKPNPDRTG